MDHQWTHVPGIGPISYEDLWKAAYLRSEAHSLHDVDEAKQTAFSVLYLVGAGACTTYAAFAEINATTSACRDYDDHLCRLIREGFLTDQRGIYALTPLGRVALVGYTLEPAATPPDVP